VIKLAKQSAIELIEKPIEPKELYNGDECFITSSGAGIVPITRIWNRKIGSGKCGTITQKLILLYQAEKRRK
jgi:branched-chain amino acid aminotransferase